MRIIEVEPTDLFVGAAGDPLQVVRVALSEPAPVVITGPGVHGEGMPGEIGVRVESAPPGTVLPITVRAGDARAEAQLTVAEPGWTVWMVPHFHYDPVWWNTQAAYTTTWDASGDTAQQFRIDFQQTGFELMRLHLRTARQDPDYRFVLAEIDYLKPYWDAHPGDRTLLRRLLAEGRIELMGGTYNEPNTNLTSAESTVRNLIYGIGFQRGVMGGDPQTAWQLDVFGHDPQFPGLVADAGLTSSSWARGPYHQWGPMLTDRDREQDGWGDPSGMQFPAEFEWLSPSGRGVLTHYMPAHYSAGWWMDSATTAEEAQDAVLELYRLMRKVSATRNILLPVGTDYTPPNRWVTRIHRDFAARYTWPRLVCALPRDFFAAVRAELPAPLPQTRDMNPVYTGKDVSFIDTKQAQRAAESLLTDAEKFATLAAVETGAAYPYARIDKAWRQLAYGAHHDAITGSESDQVYLDLVTSWREAYDTGRDVLAASLRRLGAEDAISVFNPSSWPRTDLVRTRMTLPPGFHGWELADGTPVLVENPVHHEDGSLAEADLVFLARDVPSLGYRVYRPRPSRTGAGWTRAEGRRISTATHTLEVDPGRGGCVSRLTVEGRELLQAGRVGNELLVYEEYPAHPRYHEGPWHLVPSGPVTGSASRPAESVTVETSPLGERITVTGAVGPVAYTQTLTLWHGLDRLDGVTHVDAFDGADQLLRLRWPVHVPGALPVSEVADAVIGRGFGLIDVDSGEHPWTLDNPAGNWFALSSTARVELPGGARAIGIAEIVTPDGGGARDLAVALVKAGVTSTCSAAPGARYGDLAIDSNLPDVRITIGGPEENPFTAEVLSGAYADAFAEQLAATGRVRLWIPADSALEKVWVPGADLRGARALPVLVVAGEGAVDALVADLDDAVIEVAEGGALTEPPLDDYTVALVNQGVPGFAVDTGGALHLSLMRSCTGWPSGIWIDPPHRTTPDGSAFQQQHWTHSFDYTLLAGAGDWRARGVVPLAHDINHPLRASRGERRGQPEQRSYLSVEPAGQVVLTALKPTGNHLSDGHTPDQVESLTMRWHEAAGRDTRAVITTDLPVAEAYRADLLERPGAPLPDLTLDLCGMDIATVVTPLTGPVGGPAPGREPHQPVFTRYWLHNTGPAPTGNMPLALHVEPPVLRGAGGELTVTVASALADRHATGEVEFVLPEGWPIPTGLLPYDLQPGAHTSRTVRITPPASAGAGTYWVRARTTHDGQVFEDVTRVVIGDDPAAEPVATPGTTGVRLPPGGSGTVEVTLTSQVSTAVSVQAQLISPWGTFELFPTWNTGTEVPAHGASVIRFPVTVPAGTRPGRWWAVVKLAAAGWLHYTEAVEIEVTR
ncbi:NEW3 domain-containing protein [Streptomyces sp. NBC_00234]|uniref:glycoside hydrolase family 38 N-terminal domain-containing protein n=1 Tax=Streptomyces sp. NBC_00234 TaxID=2903638 RepID=UPI002E29A753|nr:NEW3 domain-containing protein [Streptomyces sp. NBC_00234]